MTAVLAAYSSPYDAAFFTGSPGATDLVPGIFDVAIGGHPYMLDLSHDSVESISLWLREETLPLIRDQADQGREPGEQSISPQQMWRRSQETWHKGAGQLFLDREESDRARFRTSKGVDIWDKWRLGLLEDTERVDSFVGGSGSSLLIVGSRAYAASGASGHLRTAPDPLSTWANVTGIPASACTSLAADGVLVYQAFGTNGIYRTDSVATPTTSASFVTGTVALVGYLKGRLLAASGQNLYEITGSGALPAALFTHPNTNWSWVGFAEGDEFIYAAGNAGSFTAVYKIPVTAGTTALGSPQAAMSGLPVGETIRSIHGVFGFVFLGTSRGVRFCAVTDTGDLQVGALIETSSPVSGFTTWDRFTYFTWSDYDAVSSGLGRLDPSIINDGLVPAYASDVMAAVTGTVNAVAILPSGSGEHGHPVFTIDGDGVWRCIEDVPVDSGELRTGLISYGLADYKIAGFLDLRHEPLPASTDISVSLIADEGTPEPIGSSNVDGSVAPPPVSCQRTRAELFELVFTLNASATEAPVLRRWTLRTIPAARPSSAWTLPLRLEEMLSTAHDVEYHLNPQDELSFLRDLRNSREVVNLNLGVETFQVIVADMTWVPNRNTLTEAVPNFNWTGTLAVTLHEISSM